MSQDHATALQPGQHSKTVSKRKKCILQGVLACLIRQEELRPARREHLLGGPLSLGISELGDLSDNRSGRHSENYSHDLSVHGEKVVGADLEKRNYHR